MKKLAIFIIVSLIICSLSLAACQNDESQNPTPTPVKVETYLDHAQPYQIIAEEKLTKDDPERSVGLWRITSKDASGFEEYAQTAAQAVLDLYKLNKRDYTSVILVPEDGIQIFYADASFATDGKGAAGMAGDAPAEEGYWKIWAADRELTERELAIAKLLFAKVDDFPSADPSESPSYDKPALRRYISDTLNIPYEEVKMPILNTTEYKLNQSFVDWTISACGKAEDKTPPTVQSTATITPITVIGGLPYPPVNPLSNAKPELIGRDWYFDVPADNSGDIIVGYNYNSNCITSYDPISGMKQELVHLPASRRNMGKPSVYGNKFVYITGHFDFEIASASSLIWPPPTSDFIIAVFDMTTGEIKNLTKDNHNKAYPTICGNTVVWLDGRHSEGSLYDLYSYDLKTGLEKRLTSTTSAVYESVVINKDWVVWIDQRNGENKYDVYAYDLKHNKEKRLTSASHDGIYNLCGSGDYVVWQDDRNANPQSHTVYDYTYNQDIYMYDLTQGKEQQITSYSGRDHSPVIDGARIVWVRDTGEGSGDVFAYDINTCQETKVSNTGDAQYNQPAIKDDLVLWANSDTRNICPCKTGLDDFSTVSSLSLYDLNTQQRTSINLPAQVWDSWGKFSCDPIIIDKSNVLYTLGDQSGRSWVYAVGVDAGEFAIYGVTHKMTEDQMSQTKLDDFDLMEKPIVTVDDIVSYDRKTGEIELSQAGLARFNNAAGIVIGQPFVVCVGTERIFYGVFWSMASSVALPGVKIYVFPPTGILISPTLNITVFGLTDVADPLADARILRSFGHAGKLK